MEKVHPVKPAPLPRSSLDEHYNQLMAELRQRLKILALKIEPKVYEYGFLKK